MTPQASQLLQRLFVVIPAVVATLVVVGIWQTAAPRSKRWTWSGVVVTWMAGWGALAASGWLAAPSGLLPRPAVVMVAALAGGLWLGLGPVGRGVAAAIPLWILVLVQAFRLPLEFVMDRAAGEGVMPPELSMHGQNGDVLTGGLALLLGLAMRLWPAAETLRLWVRRWNLLGLLMLANIVRIAVLSLPMVRAFGDDPRHVNTWVLHAPFVWLPTVLVVVAVAGHLTVWRALTGAPQKLAAGSTDA